MKAKIAVATVSGKAYYLLVNELKKRGADFLSLTPYETVPLDIEVVITTEAERHLVKHATILTYKDNADPVEIVNEAIRNIQSKEGITETIVIGVDPGKTFGVAVLSNGKLLETATCASIDEALTTITAALSKLHATNQIVKVGDGAPSITTELLPKLDESLPRDVAIEVVREAGTSRFVGETLHKRGLRDALSAVKIAERRGQQLRRSEGREKTE